MRVLLRLLVYLLAMGIGALLAVINFMPEMGSVVFMWLLTSYGRLAASGLAAILLIAPLLLLLRWLRVLRRAREISYQTENGRITVSLLAIEEALTRAVEGEPEVKKAQVRVHEDRVRRAVVIDAAMTLWEVPNVTERNRFCQRLLRRRFAELMPEQQTVEVNLAVHRLNVRRPDLKPSESTATSAPAQAASPLATSPEASTPLPRPSITRSEAEDVPLPEQPTEEDLYVGPAYPVPKEDEDDSGQGYYARPASRRYEKKRS